MTIYAIGAEAFTWDLCAVNQEASVGSDSLYGGKGPALFIDASAALLAGSSLTEAWIRFNIASSPGGTPASLPIFAFFNSSTDKDAVRISWTGNNEFTVTYNSSGTTYTTLGTFYSAFSGGYEGYGIAWDVYFKRGSSGVVKVFANNTKVFEYTGALNTPDSTFDGARFSGNDTVRTFNFGGVIFSDEPMFNSKLARLIPTGAGNENGWSLNTFSNVDDSDFDTNFEDGNYVNTTGAANTHSMQDLSPYTDRKFAAVVAYVHAAIATGATPTGMNFRIRQGSSNYTRGALSITPGEPPKGYREIYTLDMLGSPWTESNINSLNVGVITT